MTLNRTNRAVGVRSRGARRRTPHRFGALRRWPRLGTGCRRVNGSNPSSELRRDRCAGPAQSAFSASAAASSDPASHRGRRPYPGQCRKPACPRCSGGLAGDFPSAIASKLASYHNVVAASLAGSMARIRFITPAGCKIGYAGHPLPHAAFAPLRFLRTMVVLPFHFHTRHSHSPRWPCGLALILASSLAACSTTSAKPPPASVPVNLTVFSLHGFGRAIGPG